jgi:hypothetical protein
MSFFGMLNTLGCCLALCLLSQNAKPDGGHHIAPSRILRMWALAKEFFDVPLQDKLDVHVKNSSNHRGYFSSLDYNEFNRDPAGTFLRPSDRV